MKIILVVFSKIKALSFGAKMLIGTTTIIAVCGISTAAVILSNPELTREIGMTLRQETEETVEEAEELDFEKIEEEDPEKEEGTSEIKQAGKKGVRIKSYQVTFDRDHNEIARLLLSDEVREEPINEITIVGTKKKVAPVATPQVNGSTSQQPASDPCKDVMGGRGCPTKSRAEYTALGGWEKLVKSNYEMHINYDWSIYNTHISQSANLCYGSIYIDYDTLTVTGVSWDDQPTPTCDPVRNELPPLPSAEYLTNYLRSIAQ